MQTRILGTTMPVLEVDLNPNESVFSESGELSWMTASIQMTTHTQMGGGGGVFGVLKRAVAGASIFMTEYRAIQYPGSVSFATKVPGHIVPVDLTPGQEYLVHRHGFLCATPQVTITIGFQQSLGAGIFGGDGFVLQRVGGMGTAWLELSGELVQKTLAPGEVLRVHPGHVGAFQATVGFQITMVPGLKNMIFGGDGLFLAEMVGPGTIWLQTLPISRLAHQIYEYLPKAPAQQGAAVGGAGLLGGIVGSLLNGGQ
ncbi:MAG: TIGR00266 family protein [Terracidiphilus sp.]